MSRKYDTNGDDDTDGDDFAALGSRFARITAGVEDRKFHRARHDSDSRDERAPKRKSFRPRERSHHDELS